MVCETPRLFAPRAGKIANSADKESSNQFYVIVEKILSGKEELPADWPVQGTTGYEFLNAVNRLFVHPEGGRAAEQTYSAFLKNGVNYQELLYQKKRLVMSTLLAVEMRYLGRQLGILAEHDRFARDIPRADLAQALIEVTASLSVYRTYIREMNVPRDAKLYIEAAVAAARSRKPNMNSASFDFVRSVLLMEDGRYHFPNSAKPAWLLSCAGNNLPDRSSPRGSRTPLFTFIVRLFL